MRSWINAIKSLWVILGSHKKGHLYVKQKKDADIKLVDVLVKFLESQ